MKRLIHLAMLLSLAAMATGCASTGAYLVDRGRDAADVITATVGLGIGGKVRAGRAQVGLLVNGDVFGIRGGALDVLMWPYCVDYDLLLLFVPYYGIFGEEKYDSFLVSVNDRDKTFAAVKRTPFTQSATRSENISAKNYLPASYKTQLEAVVGLGISVRLGFNPGELLDFILGWTTIDIFNDDLEGRKRRKARIEAAGADG